MARICAKSSRNSHAKTSKTCWPKLGLKSDGTKMSSTNSPLACQSEPSENRETLQTETKAETSEQGGCPNESTTHTEVVARKTGEKYENQRNRTKGDIEQRKDPDYPNIT